MNLDLLDFELRRDEGVRNTQYLDTRGVLTIGVGHNMVVNPLSDDWTQPLSDEQVDQLLNDDLQKVFSELDQNCPWWSNLDEVRQRVIANMCFNLGINGLLGFNVTLHLMRTGDYSGAADAMAASKWANQVGARATRLIAAMKSGIMQN